MLNPNVQTGSRSFFLIRIQICNPTLMAFSGYKYITDIPIIIIYYHREATRRRTLSLKNILLQYFPLNFHDRKQLRYKLFSKFAIIANAFRLYRLKTKNHLVKTVFFCYFPIWSWFEGINTECPKSYCKSVLQLLRYTTNLYLKRCSTDLR